MTSTDDILRKYESRIKREMNQFNSSPAAYSKSYETFKSSLSPELSSYEKWCKSFGNLFKIKVGPKDEKRISRAIEIAHLNVTSSEVVVFSVMALFATLFGGILLQTAIWFFTEEFSFMFIFLNLILSISLFFYTSKIPERKAILWRLKASSQMVPAILYIVIYMKHTSNFEKAVAFASEHLQPPLALDFKKVFYDVSVGHFSSIKDSLDNYLITWKDYSTEFIEAFHLIESSLYEPSEARRVLVLEKSLQVILDGVYDKMLKYTHDVKAPLTNIYMLGIVLPTLALAILPLASTLLGGAIKWQHVFLLFNVLIPLLVLYMTQKVMLERPGGYGETSYLEKNPLYADYKSRRHLIKGILFGIPVILIGLIPFIWMYTPIPSWFNLQKDYTWGQIGLPIFGRDAGIFGILQSSSGVGYVGPFGSLSLILSVFVPLGIAIIFIVAYKSKTKELIKERDKYKDVEKEFTSSLFQLGNRLGDGTPAEIAFLKVSNSVKGTTTEGFFMLVNENIQRLGMSLERALFDSKRGAVIFYPSELIATSMRILVESVKKGLKVAARSLMSISSYVKNIRKINDRLNDLLADIISDMKSNMTFLAPLLSGIIVGLAGMITTILGSLERLLSSGGLGDSGLEGLGGLSNITRIFDLQTMIPTYFLQIVVGVYLIQIVFILTTTLVTIRSGQDKLAEDYELSRNLRRTMVLYLIVSTLAVIVLSLVGSVALSGFVG